jgi:hypothetical protein
MSNRQKTSSFRAMQGDFDGEKEREKDKNKPPRGGRG